MWFFRGKISYLVVLILSLLRAERQVLVAAWEFSTYPDSRVLYPLYVNRSVSDEPISISVSGGVFDFDRLSSLMVTGWKSMTLEEAFASEEYLSLKLSPPDGKYFNLSELRLAIVDDSSQRQWGYLVGRAATMATKTVQNVEPRSGNMHTFAQQHYLESEIEIRLYAWGADDGSATGIGVRGGVDVELWAEAVPSSGFSSWMDSLDHSVDLLVDEDQDNLDLWQEYALGFSDAVPNPDYASLVKLSQDAPQKWEFFYNSTQDSAGVKLEVSTSNTPMFEEVWRFKNGVKWLDEATCSETETVMQGALKKVTLELNDTTPTALARYTHWNQNHQDYLESLEALPTDTDGDHFTDDWELSQGSPPYDIHNFLDAVGDYDGDGILNLIEYQASSLYHNLSPAVANDKPSVDISISETDLYEVGQNETTITLTCTESTDMAQVSVFLKLNAISSGDSLGADSTDYELTNQLGEPVTFPLQIHTGSATELTLRLLDDGIAEYPEHLQVELVPSFYYDVPADETRVTSLFFYDAPNLPEYETTFFSTLTGTQANAKGSGTASIRINGTRREAVMWLLFEGLESPQVSAEIIRTSNPADAGYRYQLNQVRGDFWQIQSTDKASAQNFIDALFQQNTEALEVVIKSANQPNGELNGVFTSERNTDTFTIPPAPPAITRIAENDLDRDIVRFLSQASFGASETDFITLKDWVQNTYEGDRMAAYDAWIDQQFSFTPTSLFELCYAMDERVFQLNEVERNSHYFLYPETVQQTINEVEAGALATLMTGARDQLIQKTALALSEILVVSSADPFQTSYGIASYWDTLAINSKNTYLDVLKSVAMHPAMGNYLSHIKNQKATYDEEGNLITAPDENFARELLQLFSLGIFDLHPDGSLKLNELSVIQESYTQRDIANLARVLTGWGYAVHSTGPNNGPWAIEANPNFLWALIDQSERLRDYALTQPMKAFESFHDTDAKVLLGQDIPAGQTTEEDLDSALEIIYQHDNLAPFIAFRLIQRFVTSNPSRDYVYRVAQVFNNDGEGNRGSMPAVIKAILLDYEARELSLADRANSGKIKESFIGLIQQMRLLGVTSDFEPTVADLVTYGLPANEQANLNLSLPFSTDDHHFWMRYRTPDVYDVPMFAPHVFNFYYPDYAPPDDTLAAGLVAPELQSLSDGRIVEKINGWAMYSFIKYPEYRSALYFDVQPWIERYSAHVGTDAEKVEALFDELDLFLTAGSFRHDYSDRAGETPRSLILDLVNAETDLEFKIRSMIYLITTSAHYAAQR